MEKPNRLDLEALKLIHKLEATLTIASSEQSNEREIRQMVWFKVSETQWTRKYVKY